MKPKWALITADTFIVFSRKSFATVFTIFISTRITTPWFVWIFFVLFNYIITKISAFPVIILFKFFTSNKVTITGSCSTFVTFWCNVWTFSFSRNNDVMKKSLGKTIPPPPVNKVLTLSSWLQSLYTKELFIELLNI